VWPTELHPDASRAYAGLREAYLMTDKKAPAVESMRCTERCWRANIGKQGLVTATVVFSITIPSVSITDYLSSNGYRSPKPAPPSTLLTL
jgi:hypothetical protein